MSRRRLSIAIAAVTSCLVMGFGASSASADHHLMKIREFSTGNFDAGFNDAFVVLQMHSAGQQLVGGHTLNVWDHTSSTPTPTTFAANVGNGQNQATIMIGDTSVGGTADATNMALNLIQTSGGGLICWENIDCVSIGTGPPAGVIPPSAVGTAAPFPFGGQAIRRTIARGCPTALDVPDDTNNGAADFSVTNSPQPRNNATAPTEQTCENAGVGGVPSLKCRGRTATLRGTAGKDNLKGTAERDVIVAGAGNDKVNGLAGNDLICGEDGKDTLRGGAGKDLLAGGAGADLLAGGAKKDKLLGQAGKDVCKGGAAADTATKCETEKTL